MKNLFRLFVLIVTLLAGVSSTTRAQTNLPPAEAVAVAATNLVVAAPSQPTFGLDRVQALQMEVSGYPLWQYVASMVWVVLAFVVGAIIDWLLTQQLRRLTAKTQTDLDDKLIELLHTPVKVIVTMIMLNAGVHMFTWPDWTERLLSTLFVLAMAGTIIYLAMRLIDLLLLFAERRFFSDDAQLARLMAPVVSKSLKVFALIIGGLTVAQYMGVPIASVIAGLGIGGIAVALAAQNTLANVFGTITLLADRPFRVGDRIQVEGVDGAVETIGLRSTRIRTLDGHLTTVPNKIMADSKINNVSLRPNIRQLITLNLVYGTTPAKMQEAVNMLREIFAQHPLTHDAWVYWKDYGAHSLDIFIVYWCKSTDFKEFLGTLQEINVTIKERFDAAGLSFAYPTQTIELQSVPPSEQPPDKERPVV